MHFRTAAVIVGLVTGSITTIFAQEESAPLVVSNWPAPLYFQLAEQDTDNSKAGRRAAQADISGLSSFVAVTPCRIVDTRGETGQVDSYGPPIVEAGQTRTFALKNMPFIVSPCGISTLAVAYSLNFTVIPAGSKLGYLTAWPSGSARPTVSTLNSPNGQVVANAAVVPAGPNGAIDVFVTDRTHVVIDINGYYTSQPPESSLRGIAYKTASPQTLTTTGSIVEFAEAQLSDAGVHTEGDSWYFQTPTAGVYLIAVRGACGGSLPGTTCRVQVVKKDVGTLFHEVIAGASTTLGLVGGGPYEVSFNITEYLPANKMVYVVGNGSLPVSFNGQISIVRLRN